MTRHFPFLDRLTVASVLSLYVVCVLLYLVLNATAEALPVSKGMFPVAVEGDDRLVRGLGYTVAPSGSVVRVEANRVSAELAPGVEGTLVGGFLYEDIKDANEAIAAQGGPGLAAPILIDEDPLRQDVLMSYTGGALAPPPREELPPPPAGPRAEVTAARLDEYFASGALAAGAAQTGLSLDIERALKPVSFTDGEEKELKVPGAEMLEIVRRLFTPLVLVLPIIVLANLFALIVSREKFAGLLEVLLPYEGRARYVARRLLPLLAVAMALEAALLLSLGAAWLDLVAVVALLLPMALVYFLANLLVAVACASASQVSNIIILANLAISTYFIVPSFFLNVSERAALSPLSAVVQLLNGLPVDSGATLRALSFTALVAALLAYWLALLFRGERVVASGSLRTTLSSALVRYAPRRGFLASFFAAYGATAVIAGFAAQALLAGALARGPAMVPIAIALFVLMEEGLKAWPLAALDLPREARGREVGLAAVAGASFFLTEKYLQLLFLRLLFGVDYLYALLHALFQTRAFYTTLLVHPLAAALFAHLRFGRGLGLWPSLGAAAALHLAYNALVLSGWWI